MSKYNNAPLVEVIFEIKWGRSTMVGNEIRMINFTPEETTLMPGKFQVAASNIGFNNYELLKNQPPIPHLVQHRFRKQPGSYPLYQLGNGVFAINQLDCDGYSYDWDIFRGDIERGISLFEKSYPFSIKDLPLLDIQLRYRDILELPEGVCSLEYISSNLCIGNIEVSPKLIGNQNLDINCPSPSITLQFGCKKPEGKIICQINEGLRADKKVLVLDFIVASDFNVFPETTAEYLISWCADAHEQNKAIFEAIISDKLLETFK